MNQSEARPRHLENGSRANTGHTPDPLPPATGNQKGNPCLTALIRSISDEIWYADKSGHFTLVNPTGRREFKLPTNGDANIRRLARSLEVLRPDGTKRPIKESPPLRALRGQTVKNQEEIIRTPATGELRHRQVSAAPVRDAKGRTVGSVSVVRDITQLKQIETALRENEQRYRMAVDFTRDWEYWLDPSGQFIYTSPSCVRITGYTAAAFQARPGLMRSLIHPADRARHDAHLEHCENCRKPGEAEWRIRNRNGSYRWMGHVCQPVFNDQGRYLGTRGSNRDITDRKLAEEALHRAQAQLEQRVLERTADLRASERSLAESEARFRQMADNVREVFWLADAKYQKMLYVSPAFETVWGRPCAELYRHPRLWAEAVHPDDRKRVHAAFCHNRQEGSSLEAEYRIIRPDGTVRWIADHGSSIRDSTGRVYRITGVARDITEGKQVELALRHSERALHAITACNEALLRSTTEAELYQLVCRIIVETGGYQTAWIGLAEEDARRRVRPVAGAGKHYGFIANAGIVWSDTPRGRGPTGTAIRTGQPSIVHNVMEDPRIRPWRQAARRGGYNSSLALPLVSQGRTFGALTIYAAEAMAFHDDEVSLLMQLADDLAYGVTALHAQAARRRLEQQILEISEREQRRIGQDLHDGLGQRIAAAHLLCSAVAHHLDELHHESAPCLARIRGELAQALEETRQIARGLHPVRPGPQALMSALDELADHITRMSRIPCRLVCRRPVFFQDHTAATHLYRITQEAVNNAVRHARPGHIRITLAQRDGHINLRVEDDGKGLPTPAGSQTGLGLEIMRYRSSLIGAQFTMASKPGRGTVISCSFPHACTANVRNRNPFRKTPPLAQRKGVASPVKFVDSE